jgi:ribonuclease E
MHADRPGTDRSAAPERAPHVILPEVSTPAPAPVTFNLPVLPPIPVAPVVDEAHEQAAAPAIEPVIEPIITTPAKTVHVEAAPVTEVVRLPDALTPPSPLPPVEAEAQIPVAVEQPELDTANEQAPVVHQHAESKPHVEPEPAVVPAPAISEISEPVKLLAEANSTIAPSEVATATEPSAPSTTLPKQGDLLAPPHHEPQVVEHAPVNVPDDGALDEKRADKSS